MLCRNHVRRVNVLGRQHSPSLPLLPLRGLRHLLPRTANRNGVFKRKGSLPCALSLGKVRRLFHSQSLFTCFSSQARAAGFFACLAGTAVCFSLAFLTLPLLAAQPPFHSRTPMGEGMTSLPFFPPLPTPILLFDGAQGWVGTWATARLAPIYARMGYKGSGFIPTGALPCACFPSQRRSTG